VLFRSLRWYVNRLAERTGLEATFDSEPCLVEVPFALRNACFRVAQESLTNVVRHSRARHVHVRLQVLADEVRLDIHDDGIGFDVTVARERALRGGSLGLLGMQERIELLAGKFDIESQPGRGTTIRILLPFAEQSPLAKAEIA
jgi:signal transduction histidine kinase